MINRYLSDYGKFKCIADKCPATCCSGWQIMIDDEALGKYSSDKSYFGGNVDWIGECFKQKENGDCAFLEKNGLCRLIIEKGEKYLCRTCDMYPRHVEEFPDVREYSLSVSCPEAALSLLKSKIRISFSEELTGEKDECEYEDFDAELYEMLFECRKKLFAVFESSLSFDEKCSVILKYMHNVQNYYDGLENSIKDPESFAPETKTEMRKEDFEILYELEPLNEDFRSFLKDTERKLAGSQEKALANLQSNHAGLELQCENILYYFLFTYMCGAVYDEYIYSMAAQAVFNARMIRLLWAGEEYGKNIVLSTEKQAEILYMYSREIEHSNENMILLEQLLDRQ